MNYTIHHIIARRGLIQVVARLEDDKWIEVEVYAPKEPYPGKMNEMCVAEDPEDYEKWLSQQPTEKKLVRDWTHKVIYFSPSHTEDEIKFCFDCWADWKDYGLKLANTYDGKKDVPWNPKNQAAAEQRAEEVMLIWQL